jgi:hypothetical protein
MHVRDNDPVFHFDLPALASRTYGGCSVTTASFETRVISLVLLSDRIE